MSDENPDRGYSPAEEPSVLDYFKSLFRFGNGERIRIPSFVEEEPRSVPSILTQPEQLPVETQEQLPAFSVQPSAFYLPPSTPFPWRSLLAFAAALTAQKTFEPPHTSTGLGLVLYVVALSLLGWAIFHGEWNLAPLAPTSDGTDPLTYRG